MIDLPMTFGDCTFEIQARLAVTSGSLARIFDSIKKWQTSTDETRRN
jgi:hypothetical protein